MRYASWEGRDRGGSDPSYDPPMKVVKSNSTNLALRGRGLLVGVEGAATLVYDDPSGGAEIVCADVPLQRGYNPLGNVKRINVGGVADDIWVVF